MVDLFLWILLFFYNFCHILEPDNTQVIVFIDESVTLSTLIHSGVLLVYTQSFQKKTTSLVAHIKGICVDFVDSMKKSVDLRSSAAFFKKIFFVTKTISEGHWPLKAMKTTKSVIFETRLSGLRARGYTPLVWCFFCKFKKSVQCENACEYFFNYG